MSVRWTAWRLVRVRLRLRQRRRLSSEESLMGSMGVRKENVVSKSWLPRILEILRGHFARTQSRRRWLSRRSQYF